MSFRDLDEFLSVEPIVLPIRGTAYSFPGEISARTWLRLQRVWQTIERAGDPDAEAVSDFDEAQLMAEMFGGVDEQMAADGVTSAEIKRVFVTLMAYHLSGREAAENVWNNSGEAVAPNRAARRHPATTSTPSRGSRAGSTPRAKTASAGATSSATGT